MSPLTDQAHIYRILDLTADASAHNSACCARQATPLYNQRKSLVRLGAKLVKQRQARADELHALEVALGITLFGDDE